MAGNISLLLFSFLFICVVTIYLFKRWPDLDVIDLYIIFVALHFGLSPFIRGLYFGKDVIFDFRNSNPLAIGLVFIQVLMILVIIRGLSLYFIPVFMNSLKIINLIPQWGDINKYVLISLCFWLITFQFISYYIYGIRTYIMPDDFARIGKDLPYWFTSTRTIYNSIAFCGFIGLFSIIINSNKYQRYLWIILTVIFVPIVTVFGRRYFIEMIIVSVIFWFAYRKENIFRLRYLTVGFALLCAFFLFSNIFQAYRSIFQTVGQVEPDKMKNPFSAALNFNSTINNFKERPGTWEFNFLVINNQIDKSEMTTNGKVMWEAFKSSVPRFFWPRKQFSLVDDILSKLYKVNPKEIDIGKNLFGLGQVDFGYFSIIIVPAIVLFIIYLMEISIKITAPYPTFSWLIAGNIILYLINIEENGNEIFFMLRNIIIIMTILLFYLLIRKIYSTFLSKTAGN